MSRSPDSRPAILMMAYTYYESDPRVIREAEAAVSGGFEVDFLALRKPGRPPEEMIRGVRVIRLNQAKYRGGGRVRYLMGYGKFFFRCFARTTALFFRRRYGAIHVNNMPDFLVFSTLIPRLLGAKVILDIHDPMPNTFASKFQGAERGFYYRALLWQERFSAAYSNRVLTVHHPVKEGILMKHGLTSESVEVVANFADDELFPVQRSYTLNGRIRFVFHGTILARSGLRLLMAGLAQVGHKNRISVTIIGEGDFSEGLKALIYELGLEDVVEFENRSYPAHSLAGRLDGFHAGLAPLEISSATRFALPLKLLEYISLGLPVLSVRNDAISYYLSEQDCIFVDWEDACSVAAAFDSIAEDPGILMRYRERSLALRGRFSWSGERSKYVALLRELTGVAGTEAAANRVDGFRESGIGVR